MDKHAEKHADPVDYPSLEPPDLPGADPSPVKTRVVSPRDLPYVPQTVAEHNAWVDSLSAENFKKK